MKKLMVVAAALLGLSGVGMAAQSAQVNAATTGVVNPTKTIPWTTKVTPVKTVVQIDYRPGYGIAVWSSPNNTAIKGKTLKTGTKWRVFAQANIDGQTWYNLGGNQWIIGIYLTIPANKTVTVGSNPATVRKLSGLDKYDGQLLSATAKELRPGTKWHVYEEKSFNEEMIYNLGGNQWVMADQFK